MQISRVMTSYTQILIRYDEKRYLSQFVTEMFDFLQRGSTKGAAQYELKRFVTMATYWVPVLHNIKSISGHLQQLHLQHLHLQFVALFSVFRAENHEHIEIKWVGTGTE